MNVAELKVDLLQLVMETDNPNMLEKVIHFMKDLRKKEDWWGELSEKEQNFIQESAKQIDEGKTVSNDIVRSEMNQLLQKR